ncbi:cell division protein FtsI (penicillin-binding protein 3) [Promicromonospora umidemergens]|uniref:Cell division protein FtsI n=1 Tax=Promicromonospora umidemergens TaxID=629679 RepID=A0ABP8XXI9_9MICO|nr:penicillin-binding transpeptidase domain-containing protein [Promicromonospora umidemergens]MCP2284226.1 cell division protein FtsI (penicillin-binding protein 3) [Promicromonospora umidemergens]
MTRPASGSGRQRTPSGGAAGPRAGQPRAQPARQGKQAAAPRRKQGGVQAGKPQPRQARSQKPQPERQPSTKTQPRATSARLGLQAPRGGRTPPAKARPARSRVARPLPPRPGRPEVRQRWLVGLAVVVVLVFLVRLVHVQLIEGPSLAAKAEAARTATAVTPAHRGDITDANGVTLATSVDRYTVVADPKAIKDFRGTGRPHVDGRRVEDGALGIAQLLAPILDLPKNELAARLVGDSRYEVLAKNVVPEAQRAISDLEIRAYIRTDLTSRRTYPSRTVGGSLVGFVDHEQTGRGGIEAAYDDILSGTAGSDTYERSLDGLRIPAAGQESVPAVPGDDVALTLVHDIQWKAQDAIDEAQRTSGSEYGIAIVQDARTGEIVALADSGAVDPNDRSTAAVAGGSRAVKDVFDPGSTGKVITMAAALEGGYWNPDSRFTVPDTYTTPNGQTFHDSHDHPVQRLTLTGVLAQSSNTGTVMVGEKIPLAERQDYLQEFGFGEPTGLGLPGESVGLMPPDDVADWDGRTQYAVLFGQGLSVNAMQATSVFSTVANGGVRMAPTLFKGTTSPDGTVTPAEHEPGERVVSEETADTVVEMMEAVTEDGGTGTNAVVPGYRVAGKTGTAQMPAGDGWTYMASFIGVAPADDPRYTVSVFLKSPSTSIFGGDVAAPVFSDIMGFTLQKMDVPPSKNNDRQLRTEW